MRQGIRAMAGAALLLGLVACASAPTVKVGWDEHADFTKYHTWAWKPDGSIQDAVWAKRCQDVLSDQLATNGLKQVGLDQNPDLWAVVHARLSAQTYVASYSPDWGYGWGGWAAPYDTVTYEVPVGTMIIDLVDARHKEIVWRGRAKGEIQQGKNNEQREENLIALLKQLFAGYPPAPGTAPATKS
jgi:hypothetical protein